MRNVSLMIITVWLTLSLTACTKPVLVKPDCVRPVVKVSTIETDRDILNVLNELVTLVEQQESALDCYERALK